MSEIIQKQDDEDQFYNLDGFTKEEQQDIRKQIDMISQQNRIPVTDKLFKITPTKRGGTLPLVINLLGLIAIVAGFILADRYFQNQEQIMALEESSYESSEGGVIEELKRQAEEKLSEKEKEISKIQADLTKLDKDSALLRENMDSQIAQKEIELRSEMEAALAEERSRLQGEGISTAELEMKLIEFQSSRESSFNAELASFRSISEAAIKGKEAELERAKQVAEDILEKANREKEKIKEDTQAKEVELTAQFEAEKQALSKQTSEATRKLQELSELQRNEQLIMDQITGSYSTIINYIKTENSTAAQAGINDIRKLLNDQNLAKLPAIGKRKNVDLFFLDTLEKEIRQAGVGTTTDYSSLIGAAEALISARKSAGSGAAALANGNPYDAKRYYNEALSSLPQIAAAVDQLRIIEAEERTARSAEYLDLGNQAYTGGQLAEAVKQYRSAASGIAPDNSETLTKALNGIERALNEDRTNLAAAESRKYRDLEGTSEAKIKELEDKSQASAKVLESELKLLGEKVKSLTAQLQSTKAGISEKETENAGLEQKLISMESEKSSLAIELEELKAAGSGYTVEIAALNSKIAETDQKIEQLNLASAESAKEIEALTTDAKKYTFTIETLSKKAIRAENRANELEDELNEAVNQIVELIN